MTKNEMKTFHSSICLKLIPSVFGLHSWTLLRKCQRKLQQNWITAWWVNTSSLWRRADLETKAVVVLTGQRDAEQKAKFKMCWLPALNSEQLLYTVQRHCLLREFRNSTAEWDICLGYISVTCHHPLTFQQSGQSSGSDPVSFKCNL